jgi:hypothetical protein
MGTGSMRKLLFVGAHGEEAEDVALQSDGRILTAGVRFTTPTDTDFVVARYQGGPR